jgi:hypothetical protein
MVSPWYKIGYTVNRRLSLFADSLSFTDINGSKVVIKATLSDFMLDLIKKNKINEI